MKTIVKILAVSAIICTLIFLVLYIKEHPVKSIASYLVVDGIIRFIVRSRRIITLGIGLIVLIYCSKKLYGFLRS